MPAMRRGLLLSIFVSSSLTFGCGDDGNAGEGGSGSSGSGSTAATPMTTADPTNDPTNMTGTSSTGTADTTMSSTSMETTASTMETTTEPTEGTESTGGEPVDYPPCTEMDPQCPPPYEVCYEFSGPNHSVCTQPCMQDDECPVPTTGDATPVCAGQDGDQCLLNCANGATCPDGMECLDIGEMGMFFRCAWPNA